MELKDFIKSTLVDIVRGVEEANIELDERKSLAVVSPHGNYTSHKTYETANGQVYGPPAEIITFDVAVTARDTKDNEGKVGVSVLNLIGIGTTRTSELENASVSRIKFTIPLLLPQNDQKQRSPDGGGIKYI